MKTTPKYYNDAVRVVPETPIEQAVLEAVLRGRGAFDEWPNPHKQGQVVRFDINRASGWTEDGKLSVSLTTWPAERSLGNFFIDDPIYQGYVWVEAQEYDDTTAIRVYWEIPRQDGVDQNWVSEFSVLPTRFFRD